jgi:hypothetical protein
LRKSNSDSKLTGEEPSELSLNRFVMDDTSDFVSNATVEASKFNHE